MNEQADVITVIFQAEKTSPQCPMCQGKVCWEGPRKGPVPSGQERGPWCLLSTFLAMSTAGLQMNPMKTTLLD